MSSKPDGAEENPNYTFYVQGKGPGASREFTLTTEMVALGDEELTIPRKLGDGSFGIVLDAPATSNTESYALKILYAHAVRDPSGRRLSKFEKQRVESELQIGLDLPRRLKEFVERHYKDIDDDFKAIAAKPGDYIVLPIAFHRRFATFIGVKDLARLDVHLSGYAYIMDKFDSSLKDLVEGPADIPEDRAEKDTADAKAGNGAEATEGNSSGNGSLGEALASRGYGRLRAATAEDRERSAVPVLEQVARGLQTLHAASFRHRDLKPANVYYKRTADRVRFRLGDLGFLNPQEDPVRAGTAVATQAIGIGTKHYRSIEQIDFCDTAECDVKVDTSGKTATLITRDPKFLETNIEEGDLAYFAKSNSRRHVMVRKVAKHADRREVHICVSASQDGGRGEGGQELPSILVNDRNTQVAFLKNPTAKTDLFGLAALLYDIVSVGDSPERFYELLRRFDVEGVSIEESIIRLYETWQAGIIDDADVSAIFSRVNGGEGEQGTVHLQVLRFLLKCMMSNASDSYYREFCFCDADVSPRTEETEKSKYEPQLAAVKAWAKVITEIKELEVALGAGRYDEVAYNVLTRPEREGFNNGTVQELVRAQAKLGDVLKSYRIGVGPVGVEDSDGGKTEWGSGEERVVARWLLTTAFIEKMDEKLQQHMNSERRQVSYMYSLAQEHLAINSNTVFFRRSVIDDKSRSLIASMRYRDPLLTRIRPFSHRFEPIWWRFGARRIMLEVTSGEPGEGAAEAKEENEVKLKAEIEYADFAFSRQEAEEGDFILPSGGGSSMVFRVCKVLEGAVQLEVCLENEPDGGLEGAKGVLKVARGIKDGYLVRKPDRVDYYAGMLAVYMFHFLVSEGSKSGSRKRDFPASAYGRMQDFPLRFSSRPSDRFGGQVAPSWHNVKRLTLELIMWLSLGGFYFDGDGMKWATEEEKWGCVHGEVVKWYETIYEFTEAKELAAGLDLLLGIGKGGRNYIKSAAKKSIKEVSSDEWEGICEEYTRGAHVGERKPTEGESEEVPKRQGSWIDQLPWNKVR